MRWSVSLRITHDRIRGGTVFARWLYVFEVQVSARSLSPFVALVGASQVEAVARHADRTRVRLAGRTVWNVSSTAEGGGVGEVIRSLLRYARGLGVDVRWLVLEGPQSFFKITKRLHNALHDNPGDGSPLGPEQAKLYDEVLAQNLPQLLLRLRPDDAVICHDPQTAGLIPSLKHAGVRVVWRCHIGQEGSAAQSDLGWRFLEPYLDKADLTVFSRQSYVPTWLTRAQAITLCPNIDPFSVKNQWMPEHCIRAILAKIGILPPNDTHDAALYVREDGRTSAVTNAAKIVRESGAASWAFPWILQVSRWDRMKGHDCVLAAFAELLKHPEDTGAELILAGPTIHGVTDDPEAPEVFAGLERTWRALPEAARRRAHLVELPMLDHEENAAMVNALQRRAALVVQASLREGFGLTVTEAMWKRRPVVASAVGGIRDQIRDGVEGMLVNDPANAIELSHALRRVLSSSALAARLGDAAYSRVCERYLSLSALERWGDLLDRLYG